MEGLVVVYCMLQLERVHLGEVLVVVVFLVEGVGRPLCGGALLAPLQDGLPAPSTRKTTSASARWTTSSYTIYGKPLLAHDNVDHYHNLHHKVVYTTR